jgi:hypothetical protein
MVDNTHGSLESLQLACTMIICGHAPAYTPSVILQKAISGTMGITLKADSHIACRAHAVPLPCRAAKGLECVFPI